MFVKTIHLLTKQYVQFQVITPEVEKIVAESGIREGMITVLTKHTTTGITVNEALECLESDMETALSLFAPEDRPYSHARMLRDLWLHRRKSHRASEGHAHRQPLPFYDLQRRSSAGRRPGCLFLRI